MLLMARVKKCTLNQTPRKFVFFLSPLLFRQMPGQKSHRAARRSQWQREADMLKQPSPSRAVRMAKRNEMKEIEREYRETLDRLSSINLLTCDNNIVDDDDDDDENNLIIITEEFTKWWGLPEVKELEELTAARDLEKHRLAGLDAEGDELLIARSPDSIKFDESETVREVLERLERDRRIFFK